ncbi:LOW QUALITY PROTEIN: alpha-1,3-mannosyl-glycoprotein 4-beta-N-acetylglucosaminyltransferase-like protein MGAT4D [Fukomys damarensis]|uniref:LOW QUALITY PROTEIN: alpha-1,3-mannosyl-glycoprotein 4-beta-N-acetylglucosaminyltransferase-like protein MGAT4D n=1 Tax=Fukomys damarensis TaxID=885580 RepID=UPI0008FF2E8A|nr:LOW QUALITY PROTEIN: alpha-1,3-mannosyl-glycoprotein 4-beta-N-acetylglucosaminyltransferase-like protein MGAT4D [Fukomys damarensis]
MSFREGVDQGPKSGQFCASPPSAFFRSAQRRPRSNLRPAREGGNQLMNCQNRILEFKENMIHFKNRSENNQQKLQKVLNEMQHEIMQRENLSKSLDEKKVDTPSEDETVSNIFEDFKLFLPHLKKIKRIYPKVIIGQGKTGVSFALGIPTVSRGNHTYLKQTLNSIVTRITPLEEKDCVVIVSVSDSNGDYAKSVVDMITKRENVKHKEKMCKQYKPSLFQHVGIHSSFTEQEQYLKVRFLKCNFGNM